MTEVPTKERIMNGLSELLSNLQMLATLLMYMLWGAIKACLPMGVLPRKSVSGELVLITGAGGGFGRLLAVRFAKLGARLVLWDINESGNDETAKLCREAEATVSTYKVDLSNRAEVYSIGEQTIKDVGDVDILVNNAGIVSGKPIVECTDQQIIRTMNINAMAHFWTLKTFLPSMLKRNHGHIVSVASAAGMSGAPNLTDYCASKHAAVGLMESLNMELANQNKDGIYTTTICPTYMSTGMFDGAKDMRGMPVMSPDYVADASMDAILSNIPIICIPKMFYVLHFIRSFMPVDAGMYLCRRLGVLSSMDNFKGPTNRIAG